MSPDSGRDAAGESRRNRPSTAGQKDRDRREVRERGEQDGVPPAQREDQVPSEPREDEEGQRRAAPGKERPCESRGREER